MREGNPTGHPGHSRNPAGDIADIGFVRAASAWLPGLRLVGLALILTSVVLTLNTIQRSIRFQGHRVTELARGA